MKIYQPAEDSYLLSNTLTSYLIDKNKSIKILDMGSGSGIQATTCKNLNFNNITAADLNSTAIKHLKKLKIKTIQSNLLQNINQKFDLIIFNPPYLPEHKFDKEIDTTGGKLGYETIIKFLQQAKINLTKNANILLLFSSLTKKNTILKHAKNLGYKYKLLNKQNLFYEKLYVYKFTI